MRCLIIDNYDSFTWNLADYAAQIFGTEPLVIRNDQYAWQDVGEVGHYDCIIVSPGPGSVVNPKDFNVSRQALEQDDIPVLGVCLGFQGLAHIYGGTVQHAPIPFHGRKSRIIHDGSDLFNGIPSTFDAVRYHSLVVSLECLPAQLHVTARTECGLIMALRHTTLPKWGVQFHPESIETHYGKRIIRNFRDAACHYSGKPIPSSRVTVAVNQTKPPITDTRQLRVFSRRLSSGLSSEAIFRKLFGKKKNSFWLDSQIVDGNMAKFSFMGCVEDDAVLSYQFTDATALSGGQEHLDVLQRKLQSVNVEGGDILPFEFLGGLVGYFSYEMKAVLAAKTAHKNKIPDSLWMQVDRYLAFDHLAGQLMAIAIGTQEDLDKVNRWMLDISQQLNNVDEEERLPQTLGCDCMPVRMNLSHERYLAAIGACKDKIVDGESYEICLTNSFAIEQEIDPLELYWVMRRENAAPFGSFIRSGDVYVLSTSPERFLKVDSTGQVQSKPIKGTCARSSSPPIDRANAVQLRQSEKDRAENLMIVDLIRNDLGMVSVHGSVKVPKLMDIESFRTVHQMVSTVESTLKPDCTLIDLLRAVFPGGSITGAPKIRTMEIIDQIEPGPRGVYCGTIGYLGYNQVADLNIAIRSLSYDGRTLRFGAGGAVTYLSDANDEFEEMLLKAEAVLRPIWHYLSRPDTPLEYRLNGNQLLLQDTAVAAELVS